MWHFKTDQSGQKKTYIALKCNLTGKPILTFQWLQLYDSSAYHFRYILINKKAAGMSAEELQLAGAIAVDRFGGGSRNLKSVFRSDRNTSLN